MEKTKRESENVKVMRRGEEEGGKKRMSALLLFWKEGVVGED